MSTKHTPGPWRWELNEAHKSLSLVGGRPRFDLTIIQPIRWGMGSATLFVRDTAEDGINLLYKLHERRDWIAPFPGREHHAAWCKGAKHPDLTLIEAAPDLLEALVMVRDADEDCKRDGLPTIPSAARAKIDAAIAKAEGKP
jgi:hypothetical protein